MKTTELMDVQVSRGTDTARVAFYTEFEETGLLGPTTPTRAPTHAPTHGLTLALTHANPHRAPLHPRPGLLGQHGRGWYEGWLRWAEAALDKAMGTRANPNPNPNPNLNPNLNPNQERAVDDFVFMRVTPNRARVRG